MSKRVLSVLLVLAITVSMCSGVVFRNRVKAVSGETVQVRIPSSAYTPVSGPTVAANANYQHLLDGLLSTACTLTATAIETPIIWTTDTPRTVTEYSITGWANSGANNHLNRYPASWTLSGSNDGGETWIVLDSRSEDMSAFINKAYTGNYFDVANPTECSMYKLKIDSIQPDAQYDGSCRFSEFFMFESRDAKTYDNTQISTDNISGSSESTKKAFDGSEDTKMEYYGTVSATSPLEILWKLDDPITATYYTIMSGGDSVSFNTRYLHTWTLSGSTDGESWVQLDSQKDYIFEKANNRDHTFPIETPGEYSYYKITATAVRGGFQSSEIKLHYATGSADQDAAEAVMDLIRAIGTVTADSEAAITAAEQAYAELTEAQKLLVTNLTELTEARSAYNALMQAKLDQDAAEAVMDLIRAIGTVTADSEAAITAAEQAYAELTEAQKLLVTNLTELTEARAEYDRLAAQADYSRVDAALASIPADLTLYTEDSVAALIAAKDEVVRDLPAAEQETVDSYAAAIEAAIAALLPRSAEMALTIESGMVTAASDGKFNITWNARLLAGENTTYDEINTSGVQFKNYGVYYAPNADALNDYRNVSVEELRQVIFDQGEDIDVYTAYGFRLKGVSANQVRAAMFYLEYELHGHSFILLSSVDEVIAVMEE